jgi:CheY-like chemotaxis protein
VSEETAAGALRPPGVLVVDDDSLIRGLLVQALLTDGFQVWGAGSGPEALELVRVRGTQIDLVLLDVRMPGMDGPRTWSLLRPEAPHLRCIFISGNLGQYEEETLLGLGADCLLSKPFALPALVKTVRSVIEKPPNPPVS